MTGVVTYEAADFVSPQYLTKVIKMATMDGIKPRVRPRDVPLRVVIDNDRGVISLACSTTDHTDMARRTRINRTGVRMTTWDIETHEEISCMIVWDEDVSPVEEVNFGRVWTAEERREQREWEGNVYRVGSARNPMDNASRAAEGYTTPAMMAYWR